MSVTRLNTECIGCLLNKYLNKIPQGTDEKTKLRYMQELLRTLADATHNMSAPEIVAEIVVLQKEILGFKDDYKEVKSYFNALMLSLEDELEVEIAKADDPLKRAVGYAMLGNYIDFGAMYSVDENKLKSMLADVNNLPVNEAELNLLKKDLQNAKQLIFITDNCGEVVLDKLLIKAILREYPNLKAEAVVRGAEVLNDATLEDAEQVGLTSVLPVCTNGNAVAGTCLSRLPEDVSAKLDSADVIIAKGQANFETLRYCGKNIYYIFMCKCQMFADRFGVPKLSGMLLNDLRMK